MAVSVTDSANPAHDSAAPQAHWAACGAALKTVSRGAGVLAVSVILGGVWGPRER